jgi:hypothetical protein
VDQNKAANDLISGNSVAVGNAMYEIGQGRIRSMGADVLRIALTMRDDRVTQQAVWALGKLGHAAALGFVVDASRSAYVETRRAAYWSLGQIGGAAAIRRLLDSQREERDERLLSVIGGALKTIRGDTPRALHQRSGDEPRRPRPQIPYQLASWRRSMRRTWITAGRLRCGRS